MNRLFFTLIFISIFFAASEAQEKTADVSKKEWITVQSDDKKLSMDFPSDFIVDTENTEFDRKSRLIGFNDGVIMELTVYKASAKNRFFKNPTALNDVNAISFKKDDFDGTRRSKKDAAGHTRTIINLGNDKGVYSIMVRVSKENEEAIGRFLFSIKINGKPLFANPKEQPQTSQTVLLGSLKSSAEVLEYSKLKSEKKDRKLIKEMISPEIIPIDFKDLTSAPIILERGKFEGLPNALNRMTQNVGEFKAVVKVSLLANGQVGDIWIYSNSSEDFIKSSAETAKKIKFIPAKKNGISVDSFEIVEYEITFFKLQ